MDSDEIAKGILKAAAVIAIVVAVGSFAAKHDELFRVLPVLGSLAISNRSRRFLAGQ
jgi:hypothetical protein